MTETSASKKTNATPSGFDRFDLHPLILRGVQAAGFTEPRPIQDETIPAALKGRDVLGLAQTGTGKTAAFALPLLDYFESEPARGPRALILAPTRELATQIDAEIRTLARFTQLKVLSIFGGVSVRGQISALRKNPEIIVGCPGRVLDLIGQRALRLGDVECLVLDEADHMFDMGFLPDLKRILKALPEERQNLLFSATMPKEIRGLADDLLEDPHVVELTRSGPAETIEHVLVPIEEGRKHALLKSILDEDDCSSAIVFTRTKRRARQLAEKLDKAGHRAVSLQGNMSQNARDRAMDGFRKSRFDVLVATDIVARGIDVQGVSHVINFDVPNTPEAYTHRIGRTGRAEREGRAVTFATSDDVAWLRATERKLGESIPLHKVEGFEHACLKSGSSSSGNSRSSGRRNAGGNAPSRGRKSNSNNRGRGGQSRRPRKQQS
ncbi:MAG: DEAD/DEAH box helicase [Deltaproteobacteria bacterium]|nr:DEAD/DEAH box helicase [Deltaproteobacteria bacterium]